MSDSLYCDIHDNPLPCWVCKAPERRAKETAEAKARTWDPVDVSGIVASYHGTCVAYGDHIEPGQLITKDGDGYSHTGCVPARHQPD